MAATRASTAMVAALELRLRNCCSLRHFLPLHANFTVTGGLLSPFLSGMLLSFTSLFPILQLAYSIKLLSAVKEPNPFSYNTVMLAAVKRGSATYCLSLYNSMLIRHGVGFVDNYTLPVLLSASASRINILECQQIHVHVAKLGFGDDVFVVNQLIKGYAICWDLEDAYRVFNESDAKDEVSWNTILNAFVNVNDVDQARRFYSHMPVKSLVAVNSMIKLFGKVGMVEDARSMFDAANCKDVITWTEMISCYQQNDLFDEAFGLFVEMRREWLLDEPLMVRIVSLCANLRDSKKGLATHSLVFRTGLKSRLNVQNALIHMYMIYQDIKAARMIFDAAVNLDAYSWNSLISGYMKCGHEDEANKMFDEMPCKDAVSWSCMISSYVENKQFQKAIGLFRDMLDGDIRPDEITLLSVISACASLSDLKEGKLVHEYIKEHRINITVPLGTDLIDMYMKCGCVEVAFEVFNVMSVKGVPAWNAVIKGLSTNNQADRALEIFAKMERCGVLPNEITFVAVLCACRHSGLVKEGQEYFNLMQEKYHIMPNEVHHGCMSDLLSRAGYAKECEEYIKAQPVELDLSPSWGALLAACRNHDEGEIGESVGRKLVEIQPSHEGFNVSLSNIYASNGRWKGVATLRGLLKNQNVEKTIGCSVLM